MDKKWKTAAISCLCTVAVLSVSFSAVTLARLKKLESNLSQVQNSVTSIDSDINSTLNTAITTITQTAEKQAEHRVRLQGCMGRVQPKGEDHADDGAHHAKGVQRRHPGAGPVQRLFTQGRGL